jgi:uncharacterized protein
MGVPPSTLDVCYRTEPYRILVGHSLGGLFAIHVLTSAPDAFNAYVGTSPSLWWDDRVVLREAEKFFAGRSDLQAFLYFTVGNELGKALKDSRTLAEMLKSRAPRGLQWEFRYMERENHVTTPHRSTYDALEALFAGWEPPAEIQTVKALQAHYAALSKRFPFVGAKLSEAVLDNFGFRLMAEHRDEAIAAFKLNVQLYPDSASAYGRLGEALDENGQLDLARANYEIAVRRATETSDPDLAALKANLQRVSKSNAK